MSYKIEIYSYGMKSKHKLYDSLKTYEQYFEARKKDVDWHARIGIPMGIRGYVNGAFDKEYGHFKVKL